MTKLVAAGTPECSIGTAKVGVGDRETPSEGLRGGRVSQAWRRRRQGALGCPCGRVLARADEVSRRMRCTQQARSMACFAAALCKRGVAAGLSCADMACRKMPGRASRKAYTRLQQAQLRGGRTRAVRRRRACRARRGLAGGARGAGGGRRRAARAVGAGCALRARGAPVARQAHCWNAEGRERGAFEWYAVWAGPAESEGTEEAWAQLPAAVNHPPANGRHA